MLYVTLLFFLAAGMFGVIGFEGLSGMAVAPIHIAFVASFLVLMACLARDLFPRRK